MGWQHVVGWIMEGLVIFFGVAFFITSAIEREKRAAILSLVLTVIMAGGWAAIMLLTGVYLPHVVGVVLVLGVVGTLAFSLPFGKSEPLLPAAAQDKVDERDIMFTRGKLTKMYPEYYDEYYQRHPEYKEIDDEIRKLPDIGEPGARYYERINTDVTNAAFEWLEDLRPFVDGHVVEEKAEMPAEDAAKRIKGYAKSLGAKLVGVTKLNQAYVYSHVGRGLGEYGEEIKLDHEYAIAIAVEMQRPFVRQAPTIVSMVETCRGYVECAKITQLMARYIRSLGHPARAHIDANYRVMCVPIAVDAGLGELSRMGYLIAKKYGPRVRIGVVTTNLPMATDSPVNLGVRDFCSKCRKCALNCPSRAIPFDVEPQDDVKGVRKWELDREACYKYWRRSGTDCAICMSVCTFSKPSSFMHRIIRFMIKQNALARRIAVIGDDFMYGKRPRCTELPDWMKAGL